MRRPIARTIAARLANLSTGHTTVRFEAGLRDALLVLTLVGQRVMWGWQPVCVRACRTTSRQSGRWSQAVCRASR